MPQEYLVISTTELTNTSESYVLSFYAKHWAVWLCQSANIQKHFIVEEEKAVDYG